MKIVHHDRSYLFFTGLQFRPREHGKNRLRTAFMKHFKIYDVHMSSLR